MSVPNRITYPPQRAVRALAALSPRRVLPGQIPLGQSPSLHPLRRRLPGFVRGLHRYYGTVRLPGLVHRRRASLDFPTRPAAPLAAGEPRTSRFSREVFPYVHGVSDRAGPGRISRYRCATVVPSALTTASASRTLLLSRLNTRPARTPVNASMPPSRETPHDSAPLWVASPSTYDSFIHNNLAGLSRRTVSKRELQTLAASLSGMSLSSKQFLVILLLMRDHHAD